MAAVKEKKKVSQKAAEKMIESGEAIIPAEAIIEKESSSIESDYAKHAKFAKFKTNNGDQKNDT